MMTKEYALKRTKSKLANIYKQTLKKVSYLQNNNSITGKINEPSFQHFVKFSHFSYTNC